MNPMFKAFLKNEGIYLTFILNVLFSSYTVSNKIKILRGLKDPDKRVINDAFPWIISTEGYDVWEVVAQHWMTFYFVMISNGYMKSHSTDLD